MRIATIALALVLVAPATARALKDNPQVSPEHPASCLVMPWTANEGQEAFHQVSNLGPSNVVTHWTYWSANCEKLADVTQCLTPNGGPPMDVRAVTNSRWVDGENVNRGDPINLQVAAESRDLPPYGVVYVSAFEARAGEFGDCESAGVLADDSIVGTWSVGDVASGVGFGGNAEGFGVSEDGSMCELPDQVLDEVVVQTFAPASLKFSAIFGYVAQENAGDDPRFPGELGPACSRRGSVVQPCVVNAETRYCDANEICTSLPDVTFSCGIQRSLLDSITASFQTSGTFRFTQPMIVPADLQLAAVPVGGTTWAGGFAGGGLGTFGVGHIAWSTTSDFVVPPSPTPQVCPEGTEPITNPSGEIVFCRPLPTPTPEPTATPEPSSTLAVVGP